METVTIDATRQGIVTVYDGRLKKSRLKWIAGNLLIYLLGKMTDDNRDTLNWHAQNQCIARRIPLTQLFIQNVERRKVEKPRDPFLRGLFDDMIEYGYQGDEFECSMCGKPCGYRDQNGHCSTCRQIWEG